MGPYQNAQTRVEEKRGRDKEGANNSGLTPVLLFKTRIKKEAPYGTGSSLAV